MNPIDSADLQRGRAASPLVCMTGLSHVVLATPALESVVEFYEDFGLVIVERSQNRARFRAAGSAPTVLELVRGEQAELRAIGVLVDSELELRKLASLPEATPIEEGPAGEWLVRLRSPGGTPFIATIGGARVEPFIPRPAVIMNGANEKKRIGAPVRVEPAPSQIVRLGHLVVDTPRPSATVLWLMRVFGMIVSDAQHLDGNEAPAIASFLRCDRGDEPTDHHTLAVALGVREGLGHLAFEVDALDDLAAGGEWLARKGHRHVWGIGRHRFGSQIFDYWRAPDGTTVEHYVDGDLFDASVPTGRSAFCGENLLQWGPRPPADFGVPPFSASLLVAATRNFLGATELSVGRLLAAKRSLSH